MRKEANIATAQRDRPLPKRINGALLVTWGEPRILVVDDDPSFGRILAEHAKQQSISLAFFRSLSEVRGKLARWRFDAAVVDSDLGDATGIEAAKYFERFILHLPVLLVSQSEWGVAPREEWPSSVKGFLPKNVGHRTILETAVKMAAKKEE